MSGNNHHDIASQDINTEAKLCPFLNKKCVQERCTMWTQIQMAQVGPLGIAQMKPAYMCVFPATMLILGSPGASQMQSMKLPPMRK